MKTVTKKCPECGMGIEAQEQTAVQWLTCPNCQHGFNAPGGRADLTPLFSVFLMFGGGLLWAFGWFSKEMDADLRMTLVYASAVMVAVSVLWMLFAAREWLLTRGGEVLLVCGLAALVFFLLTGHFPWMLAAGFVAVCGAALTLRK